MPRTKHRTWPDREQLRGFDRLRQDFANAYYRWTCLYIAAVVTALLVCQLTGLRLG